MTTRYPKSRTASNAKLLPQTAFWDIPVEHSARGHRSP
jgi:hypothetical protein